MIHVLIFQIEINSKFIYVQRIENREKRELYIYDIVDEKH